MARLLHTRGTNKLRNLAVWGSTLAAGAPLKPQGSNGSEIHGNALRAGAAYLYVSNSGVWTEEQFLKAADADSEDNYGSSVAIHNDTLAIAAPGEDASAFGGQNDNSVRGTQAYEKM